MVGKSAWRRVCCSRCVSRRRGGPNDREGALHRVPSSPGRRHGVGETALGSGAMAHGPGHRVVGVAVVDACGAVALRHLLVDAPDDVVVRRDALVDIHLPKFSSFGKFLWAQNRAGGNIHSGAVG